VAFRTTGYFNILFAFLYFGWIFSIGYSANNKLTEELRTSATAFKLGLLYAAAYMLVFLSIFGPYGANSSTEGFTMILPFHLLAMIGIFYGIWFAARQLATLREDREVKFSEFSGPFFLIWFFPIGIWFVQPLVNQLLGDEVET